MNAISPGTNRFELSRYLDYCSEMLSLTAKLAALYAQNLPDPVIIEAGAYNGGDTYELARRWPRGHIHAFEPVPELFEAVKQQTSSVKNVSYYPIALGEKNGTAEFFVSSGASNGSSSLLRPSGHLDEHPDVHFDRTLTVTVKTMDTWAAENDVSRVDFLWLDMQGAGYGS